MNQYIEQFEKYLQAEKMVDADVDRGEMVFMPSLKEQNALRANLNR